MMKSMLGVALVGGALWLASPAAAGERQPLFDLSIRWGEDRVTLGGRIDGPEGPTSGTLTGRLRRDGFVIDGWFDERGRTWIFELDANLLDGLRATVRRAPQRI